MKFLGFNKVLCLSPHPDDVEISMLGSILNNGDTGFDILCLSIGTSTDVTSDEKRHEEIRSMWDKSGCDNVDIFFSDTHFLSQMKEDEWLTYIENTYLSDNGYDCIFLPPFEDSHYEHRFVAGFGTALIRARAVSLIQYRTASTLDTWTPNLFIDVGKNYSRKEKLLKEFASQQNKPYFSNQILESFHIHFQCLKKNIRYVEQFRIINYFGE